MIVRDPGPTSINDEVLIARVAGNGTDSADGRAALAILYNRHCEALYRACTKFARGLVKSQEIEDLVHDTFIKAAKSASTYKPTGSSDPNRIAGNMYRWLQQIAYRLYLDARDIAKAIRDALTTRPEDERVHDLPSPEPPQAVATDVPTLWRSRIERATAAISTLSERDQVILVISLEWWNRETGKFNMPPDVIANLCTIYGLRIDTFEQIRYRAYKKVVKAFSGDSARVA